MGKLTSASTDQRNDKIRGEGKAARTGCLALVVISLVIVISGLLAAFQPATRMPLLRLMLVIIVVICIAKIYLQARESHI